MVMDGRASCGAGLLPGDVGGTRALVRGGKSCHLSAMLHHPHRLVACLFLILSGCGGGTPCASPKAAWLAPAPKDFDTLTLDEHDRILWNGTITSREQMRNVLALADADARTVQLVPKPGASCSMIEAMRLSMEQSLACGKGRCLEAAR